MTTQLHWIPSIVLSASLCSCVLVGSVGDDPETMDSGNLASSEGTEGGESDAGAPTTVGNSSNGNTSTTSGGNPSASSATATSTSGGFPNVEEACGIESVPPGLPGYIYDFACTDGCGLGVVVPLPLDDYDAVADCVCAGLDCGEPNGEVGEVGGGPGGTSSYEGVCDVDIMPNDGPGFYEVQCACEACNVTFEDIHPDSAEAFIDDAFACDCLCLEAGCGYSEGGGGVGGGEPGGTDGSSTTSGG
ncbi:MAG: hypothetical protein AAF721_28660 [Myxococcota bacterium]